ncbi:hypothetical protein M2138_002047 [Dysgonomonadaceae bacterium PH5-43]|nr:hypothetical protein [Dysgonomonadaceae bacterium PH5-43]
MKILLKLFYFSVLFIFCSCGSMKVSTTVLKSYPALPSEEPVMVYFSENEVPYEWEALGSVSATDGGMAGKGDSILTITILKTEARKIGGEAVLVTKYIEPSFKGSSCYQMWATIIKSKAPSVLSIENNEKSEIIIAEVQESDSISVEYPEEEKIRYRFRLSGDFGYGFRTASMPPGLDRDDREFFDSMNNGPVYKAAFGIFITENAGVGLNYSGYTSKSTDKFNVYGTTSIDYIGADYIVNGEFADSWRATVSAGLGYIHYNIRAEYHTGFSNGFLEESGGSIGFNTSVGLDYMISDKWAIGAELSYMTGLVRKIKFNENGRVSEVTVDRKDAVGLGQFRFSIGIRSYLD